MKPYENGENGSNGKNAMDEILAYLTEKYEPVGMIVYGSFADGTNGLNSDFDALLVYRGSESLHDSSFVNGTELDVFVYPESLFEGEYDVRDFLQLRDGRILADETGIVAALKEKVCAFIDGYAGKSREENEQNLAWCEKMLQRTKRNDMEGAFRLHWLLVDSLEIYTDLKGAFYPGPKKAIRQMCDTDPDSASIYCRALKEPTEENLTCWIRWLRSMGA